MKSRILRNTCFHKQFQNISYAAEVFYLRLMNYCDDNGNVRGRLHGLKDMAFPEIKFDANKNNLVQINDIEKMLLELIEAGLLIPYEKDSVEYLHFYDFHSFQHIRLDRVQKSPIPLFLNQCPGKAPDYEKYFKKL